MPGLINTHTHAPMNMLRGYADDLKLGEWLTNHMWPAGECSSPTLICARI